MKLSIICKDCRAEREINSFRELLGLGPKQNELTSEDIQRLNEYCEKSKTLFDEVQVLESQFNGDAMIIYQEIRMKHQELQMLGEITGRIRKKVEKFNGTTQGK